MSDLRHTFGARLRAMEVSFEDRQDFTWPPVEAHYNALFARWIDESMEGRREDV